MPKATSHTRKVLIELGTSDLMPALVDYLKQRHPEFRGFDITQFEFNWGAAAFEGVTITAEKTTTKEK